MCPHLSPHAEYVILSSLSPASMQVHCAHMEERDVVREASMEVGWGCV